MRSFRVEESNNNRLKNKICLHDKWMHALECCYLQLTLFYELFNDRESVEEILTNCK
jgi:hypothetical protein